MDLANNLITSGKNSYFWSGDLKRAYRQLRACPLSTPLLGITLRGHLYLDITPSFGCRTSSSACQSTTAAVVWLMEKAGFNSFCYLDDFAGVESTQEKAAAAFKCFLTLTSSLGLDLSLDKCSPPTLSLRWLGYNISSATMRVEIPKEKMQQVLQQAEAWKDKTVTTRKELQQLIGKLQHISRCVIGGRRFTARILKALRSTPHVGKHKLTEDLTSDINWFQTYATTQNGIVLVPLKPRAPYIIECDSSKKGGGAYSPTHYYMEPYTHHYA